MLSPSALNLLSAYRDRISRKEVVRNVVSLETERQFPFSLLNDLRAYINYAPHYFQVFAALLLSPEFDQHDPKLLGFLGFPTRLQRYVLSLFVLGAYLDRDFDNGHKLLALNRLSNLKSLREEDFREYTKSIATKAVHNQINRPRLEAKQQHAKLCIALREYVDFLFLGEHSIGCEIAPAMAIGNRAVVTRHFFNLDYGAYLTRATQAQLVEIYDRSDAPGFYDFRGRLENIKSYKAITCYYQEVDERVEHDESVIDSIIENIATAMECLREDYDRLSAAQLEVRKMQICSLEMARLYSYLTGNTYEIPGEVKDAILTATVSSQKMIEYRVDTYAELFFALLNNALKSLITQ